MVNKKIILIIISALLLSNIFFGFEYFSAQKKLLQTQNSLEVQDINEKVLDFAKLFVEKVLKTETEVDFETRLKLENAVRNLDDEKILIQWQKFIESKTEDEAQAAEKKAA